MLNLLPITKIVSLVVGAYAALVLIVFRVSADAATAFRYAALIDPALLLVLSVFWRQIWAACPKLNDWIYPDLNGAWVAEIHWVRDAQRGVAIGAAQIKQSFLRVSIEVDAPNSTSHTIALSVRKDQESGRPLLHYIYEVHEKHVRPGTAAIYRGAASLRVETLTTSEMSGNYFTSRSTGGHFQFRRVQESAS